MNKLLTARTKAKFSKPLFNKLVTRRIFLNRIAMDKIKLNNTILLLTGLQYERCIEELAARKIINKKSSKIVVVERDREVYETINLFAQECPFYTRDKVKIHLAELDDIACHDLQIQDIDLMGTWKTCYNVIEQRLQGQKKHCPPWQRKYMIFNVSERNGGGLDFSFKKLKKLLSDNLDFKLNGLNKTVGGFGKGLDVKTPHKWWVKGYKPIVDKGNWGRVKSFGLYRYRDSSPMTTCFISYL